MTSDQLVPRTPRRQQHTGRSISVSYLACRLRCGRRVEIGDAVAGGGDGPDLFPSLPPGQGRGLISVLALLPADRLGNNTWYLKSYHRGHPASPRDNTPALSSFDMIITSLLD